MNRPLVVLALAASAAALAATSCTSALRQRPIEARISEHVDEYHEVEVADPYRWLEDGESPETREWLRSQGEYTSTFLRFADARPGIVARLRELWNHTRYGLPVARGGRTFFEVNEGLQDQPVLYVIDEEGAEPRVLLDPNEFSSDGTVAVASWVPSWDGSLLAYALSEAGSDWRTWRVREVATGRVLKDTVEHSKLDDLIWMGSNRGFFYSRYDAPEPGRELLALNDRPDIYVHRLATSQEEDELVLERPAERSVFQTFGLLADRRTLFLSRRDVSTFRNEIYVARRPIGVAATDLRAGSLELVPMFFGFDARYEYIGDDGKTCWVFTDFDAPRGRVLAFDMEQQLLDLVPKEEEFLLIPEDNEKLEEQVVFVPQYWSELIPESEDTLVDVSLLNGRLIVHYLHDANSKVRVFDLAGEPVRDIELPAIGSVEGLEGGIEGSRTFYAFSSFLTPPTIFSYDVDTGATELFRRPLVPIDPREFETYEVFYASNDSATKVPLFLTHRKDLQFTGDNPTYLTGNGGFAVPVTPRFSIANLVWLEMGGVLAVAGVRGGGEYGDTWYQGGRARKKQNAFDDFSSGARWLIRNDYTTPSRLAIGGEFNGGLVAAACITQNPHMYGAAIISSAVLDMLRYHEFTVGWTWAGDYGTAEDRWDFHTLLRYSPLHNVQDECPYPATMVMTADHDDRVVPAHSYKFVARLQAAHAGREPILLRVDERAGQAAQKPTYKQIEEAADRWAFLHETLGMSAEEGTGHCEGSWYR